TCTAPGIRVAAIPKALLVGPGGTNQPTVQDKFMFDAGNPGAWTVQPAVNFDPVTTNDVAWFLANAPSNNQLLYNRLKWVNGTGSQPVWQDSWPGLTVTG